MMNINFTGKEYLELIKYKDNKKKEWWKNNKKNVRLFAILLTIYLSICAICVTIYNYLTY